MKDKVIKKYDKEKKLYYTNESILKGILSHTVVKGANMPYTDDVINKTQGRIKEQQNHQEQYEELSNSDFSPTDFNKHITKDFTLGEFLRSNTADAYSIKNIPNNDELNNIIKLCKEVIQPIRDTYGKPIKINSGFRCKALNEHKAVGGAPNSDHRWGAAADIKAVQGTNKELYDVIVNMARNGAIKCRQIIWEKGTDREPRWIHVSINNSHNGRQDNHIFRIR